MTDDALSLLAAGAVDPGELAVEGSLRPRTLDEYIGQREVKASLSVLLQAAKGRGEAADHVLLYGPPGLGKTTLATIIARELGVNVRYTSGPSARSLRLSLKPFTGVGATTGAGRISGPLRDRFGMTYRLDFYGEDDLAAIVRRSAGILGVEIDGDAARLIAKRGRGTPRIVNRLLRRVRDHAEVHGDGRVHVQAVDEAMTVLDIDSLGLDTTDRKLLAAIVQKFQSGPVGVQALAAVLAEETETIEDVYEPFLLRLGFLDRTPQGRIATEAARAHLASRGYEIPAPRRSEPDMPALWEDLPAR